MTSTWVIHATICISTFRQRGRGRSGQPFRVFPGRRRCERLRRIEIAPKAELVRDEPGVGIILLGKRPKRGCVPGGEGVEHRVGRLLGRERRIVFRADGDHECEHREGKEKSSHFGSPHNTHAAQLCGCAHCSCERTKICA